MLLLCPLLSPLYFPSTPLVSPYAPVPHCTPLCETTYTSLLQWMCVYIYSKFKNVYMKIRSLNFSVWSFDL